MHGPGVRAGSDTHRGSDPGAERDVSAWAAAELTTIPIAAAQRHREVAQLCTFQQFEANMRLARTSVASSALQDVPGWRRR